MEMYRFRTAYGLLDGYYELENQEIYFATPAELNDPMEGFRDIYWKGDVIVWRNLLRKYVDCLDHIYMLMMVAADKLTLSANDIPLYNWPETNIPAKRLMIRHSVRKRFFDFPVIDNFPLQLANRNSPVRRHELLAYFSFVQGFALRAIEDTYQEEGLISSRLFSFNDEQLKELSEKSAALPNLANKLEAEKEDGAVALEIFFQMTSLFKSSIGLKDFSKSAAPQIAENRMFILNDFDEAFLIKLESLVYPDWYSASFLTNCHNSAIWGHYGDNHKGVCLILRANRGK